MSTWLGYTHWVTHRFTRIVLLAIGCAALGAILSCHSSAEICTDARDNDGDGFQDCLDQDCFSDPACADTRPNRPPEGQLPGDCSDGSDNDGDGLLDCNDDGCLAAPDCLGAGDDDDDSAISDDDDSAISDDDDSAISDDDDDDTSVGDDDDATAGDDDDATAGDDDDATAGGDDDDHVSPGCGDDDDSAGPGQPPGLEVDINDIGCGDGLDGDCDGLIDCEDINDCCIYSSPGQACHGNAFCGAGDDDDDLALPPCCDTQSCLDMVADCGTAPNDPCLGQFPWTGGETGGDGPDHCSNYSAALCPSCYDGIDGDADGGADCQDPEALLVQASGDLNTPIANCFLIRSCDGDPSTDCP